MYKVMETKIRAAVGSMSLIGVSSPFPVGWGNYFWFSRACNPPEIESEAYEGIRCLNMWAENLREAENKFLHDGMVKVRIYSEGLRHWAIVIDERIPKDWLYNKLCFTGGYRPSRDICADIYGILGDPNYEMEQFEDEEMYHAKRGYTLHKNGILTWRADTTAEKLVEELHTRRSNEATENQ